MYLPGICHGTGRELVKCTEDNTFLSVFIGVLDHPLYDFDTLDYFCDCRDLL